MPSAAIHEFHLALRYDPTLLQAYCALGSSIADPIEATAEYRKALATKPNLVCALDGLARNLMKERQYEAAVDYWTQATRIEPDAPDLQLSLATAVYKEAKARQEEGLATVNGAGVADAIHILTELIKSHPDMGAAHFTLGNIYANEHRDREAANEYQEVVHQNPTDTIALGAEVEQLINASAYAEALAPALNYLRQRPHDPSGYVMVGTIYQQLGEYAKAEPDLQIGVAKAPESFEARYQLGLVLARMGKPAEALPQLRKAVALRPGDRSSQFQLVAVLRSLGQTKQAEQVVEQLRKEQGDELLNSQLVSEGIKANDLLQSGKPAEAAQIYRHMIDQKPDSAHTTYNLALALEALNNTAGAEGTLRKAIQIDPKLAIARAELGRLELAGGNLNSAQKWLESALDLAPELAEARGNMAMLEARKGNLVAAELLLHQTLADNPNYMQGYLDLGLILARQSRKPEANMELDKAVALAPHDPVILSTAGKAKLQMGESSEGIGLLRKVVDLVPNLASAHLDLALALASSYDLPAALAQVSDAVRLAPQSGIVHFYRGRILYDMGNAAQAQTEFDTACRLDQQLPEPRYFLGLIAKNQSSFPLAISLFEQTVKLQPQNTMAWYMLGECYEQETKTAKALAAWRQAIAIDPKFSQALFSLARALRSTDQAESQQLMTRYIAVQKERNILDRADTLANDGLEAASAHDWPKAIQQLKDAIAACGDCAAKAELHRKLGIIDCQAGNLANGEKELLIAKSLNPADPVTMAALALVARAQSQPSASVMEQAR
jgi:tetratricopeptide (TPR) repeat protein